MEIPVYGFLRGWIPSLQLLMMSVVGNGRIVNIWLDYAELLNHFHNTLCKMLAA